MFHSPSRFTLTILTVSLGMLLVAPACQVPVFRYALERWQADVFRLQVAHREALPADFLALLETTNSELTGTNPVANLSIETLDVSKLSETEQLSVSGLDRITEWPAILVHPPESWAKAPPFVLDATSESLQLILDSPARQTCIEHLLNGESAVWFLIESADADANEKAYKLLQAGLKAAEDSIEIPDGVIRPEDVKGSDDNVDLDNVLRSSIPLKISFKIERIRRDDPAEKFFLQLLAGPAGFTADEPVVVPVFGRGRTPGPVAASTLNEGRIGQACSYLCGACSCQIKSGNPGYDLILRASWHEHLQDGLVVVEKALPPLRGIGQPYQPTPVVAAVADASAPQASSTAWWIMGGILIAALGSGLFLLRGKKS